jgi:hypothetical protein
MNRQEVTALVAYVTQLNPGQQFDAYTADAWHDVLGDVKATFDQAREATAAVAKRERWIYPSAIREELKAILRAANPPPPAPALEAPSKYEPNEDRHERWARNHQKFEAVREQLAAIKAAKDAAHQAGISESLWKAREVARQYKRDRDRQDQEADHGNLGSSINTDPAVMVSRFKQLPERGGR